MDGMTVPFIMLLIITIGLLLERKYQEDKVVEIYEKKFEEWKEHSSTPQKIEENKYKEFVGLVFLEDEKVSIELLNKKEKIQDKLDRRKYEVKV
jgi:hypothetical protein